MSFVIRYIVSRTAADEGHRFAALSIVRPGGITNWSRTAAQNRSSGDEGVGGKSAGRGQAVPGVRNGAAPPIASSRAKSRRFKVPPRIGSPNTGMSGYPPSPRFGEARRSAKRGGGSQTCAADVRSIHSNDK